MCLYSKGAGYEELCQITFYGLARSCLNIYILHSWIKKYYVLDFRKRTNF